MVRNIVKILKFLIHTCFLLPITSMQLVATPLENTEPALYVVKFRADWCGLCKILEPALDHAIKTIDNPEIQYISIDITNAETWDNSLEIVLQNDLVDIYNQYVGITGFAALLHSKNKILLGCLTHRFDSKAMKDIIQTMYQKIITEELRLELSKRPLFCPVSVNPKPPNKD